MPIQSIACTQCGAKLQVASLSDVIRCEYCESSFVPQKAESNASVPEAQGGGARFALIALAFFTLLGVGIVVLALTATKSDTHSTGSSDTSESMPSSNEETMGNGSYRWFVSAPLFARVHGNQTAELVGLVKRYKSAGKGVESHHLRAVSGESFKTLWTSPAIPFEVDHHLQIHRASDILLVPSNAGDIAGFSAQNGRLLWTKNLGGAFKELCASDSVRVLVVTEDERWSTLTLSDGGLLASKQPDTCLPLERNVGYRGPMLKIRDKKKALLKSKAYVRSHLIKNPQLPFEIEPETGEPLLRFQYGLRKKGTKVQIVAAADDAWQQIVPAVDPLKVSRNHITVRSDDKTIVAIYGLKPKGTDKKARATSFRLKDGHRLWDVEVPDGSPTFRELKVQGSRFYLYDTWKVAVFSTDNGALLKQFP